MNKELFLKKQNNHKHIKNINLNFGPQHPAAHGVLRLILQLNGEIIEKADPHIGLLHRGTEKLIESKIYLHSIPYFDRLDYVSMMIQEHAYCLAIEKLLKNQFYNKNLLKMRTIYDELTRILNHLLAIACHALDVGSMSPIFWAFEEREKILEFYERVSGARMHAVFYRPYTLKINKFEKSLFLDILYFISNCYTTINEINNILLYNKLWKQRLINLGIYTEKHVLSFNLTGVMARCVGIKRDIRLSLLQTYAFYYFINFKSYISKNGDSYDRYILRILEIIESLNIINKVINTLTLDKGYIRTKKKTKKFKTMEDVIKHFKYWSEGIKIKQNMVFSVVESPKGEFGITLISDNSNYPYKCKIKSPAYYHLQVLPSLVIGTLIADLVALIGTIDIVFGEIDR